MNLTVHVIRRRDYRGKSNAVSLERLKLGFDAFTTPGLLFAASWIAAVQVVCPACVRNRTCCSHYPCLPQGGIRITSSRMSTASHEGLSGRPGGHHGVDATGILSVGPAPATGRMQPELQSCGCQCHDLWKPMSVPEARWQCRMVSWTTDPCRPSYILWA